MDKKLLSDYIDACELIRETEQQIRRLQEKLYGALWKLMEYEDTGVDPEEAEALLEEYRELYKTDLIKEG